ncbi:hypothetical protein ASG01_00385 [Chryseobacterium sp. Leaf180]|uniref:hypothetical protein n=1 Tax=Chryseobacterium sp. Leaf180 TaxID=1736289 RepID=UPI0006F9DC3B|nr:hypothetical protein [Chryseobacterium sp. Leaf180]KQR94381.1 hypothetical protein ASG01_00385 [Chryseobacterium sp. Leaf180]
MMNKIATFIVILFLTGCNGQEKKESKNKSMTEKFDIVQFDRDRTTVYDGDTMTSASATDTVKDGIRTRILSDEFYIEKIESEKEPFGIYKEFYKDGNLKKLASKMLVSYIDGFAPWGKVYEYDKNSKLNNETDYAKVYQNVKVNPEVLFKILKDNKIFDTDNPAKHRLSVWFHDQTLKSKEMVFNRLKYEAGENPFWEVIRDYRLHDEESVNEKVFKIDAVSGTVKEIR